MSANDSYQEDNYQEYARLQVNPDYVDVILDESSGGMSAIHRLHKFDKQMGPYGLRRGEYEIKSLEVLRKKGHRIVLESEKSSQGTKKYDGLLDDIPVEIKAIEGSGTWSISTKLRDAVKQHAQYAVLYFPKSEFFSPFRVSEGLRLYQSNPENPIGSLSKVLVIAEDRLVACWEKKATPEGWSISEGLRGQNGADPFTIPPSDAKL